jgi:hypothetical protein
MGYFRYHLRCHFTLWGISLSSTEIPGVFNPGYSQRGIFVVYFLSFLRSARRISQVLTAAVILAVVCVLSKLPSFGWNRWGCCCAQCYIMSACSNMFALTATPASYYLLPAQSARAHQCGIRIDQIGFLGANASSCNMAKRLVVSEGRGELTTKAAACC